jgi:hypothetical protein
MQQISKLERGYFLADLMLFKVIKSRIVLKNPHIGNPEVAFFWQSFTGYIDIVREPLRNVNRDQFPMFKLSIKDAF